VGMRCPANTLVSSGRYEMLRRLVHTDNKSFLAGECELFEEAIQVPSCGPKKSATQ